MPPAGVAGPGSATQSLCPALPGLAARGLAPWSGLQTSDTRADIGASLLVAPDRTRPGAPGTSPQLSVSPRSTLVSVSAWRREPLPGARPTEHCCLHQ